MLKAENVAAQMANVTVRDPEPSKVDEMARALDQKRNPDTDSTPWPPVRDLPPATERVPGLPPELLPEALREHLVDAAGRASVPLEMVAVPALSLLSSVVGAAVGIRPERFDDWTVVPNLWGAIIARPGALKSFCIGVGTRLLGPLIERAREEFDADSRAAEERRIELEFETGRLKKSAATSKATGSEATRLAEIKRELDEIDPPERRYLTNDGTVEKLGEILKRNPRGLAATRDELTGQLRTLDRPGREGDREFFLESWNGDAAFTVDRIGRGTVRIPNLCLTLLGGIQPGKLRRYISEATGDGNGADGLLQRFQLLAYPGGLGEWKAPRTWPDKPARVQAEAVFAALADLEPGRIGASQDDGDRVPWVRWSIDAQSLWNVWRTELETRLRNGELENCPAYESHVAKYRSFLPSLALLIEVTDWAAGLPRFNDGRVSLDSARKAAALVDFFDCHARKMYGAALNPGPAAAHKLAEKIKSGDLEHMMPVRDLRRAEWSGLREYDSIRPGLEELESAGRIRVSRVMTAGRPSDVILIHPDLRRADNE